MKPIHVLTNLGVQLCLFPVLHSLARAFRSAIPGPTDKHPLGEDPLPVILLNFSTTSVDKEVRVSWATTPEAEVNSFVLQYSGTDVDWSDIDKLSSADSGSVPQAGDFEDSYYRLKGIDTKGLVSYSWVDALAQGDHSGISIYPNPFNDFIYLHPDQSTPIRKLALLDLEGRTLANSNGDNLCMLDVHALMGGLYMLEVHLDSGAVLRMKVRGA